MANTRRLRVAILALALAAGASCGQVAADVRLARVFGDQMVLQADSILPVWGWANPDEAIEVRIGDSVLKTTADSSGKWSVEAPRQQASFDPIPFSVVGSNSITLSEVVVGEVWLCAGQSNMEWPLRRSAGGKAELQRAADATLRLLNLPGVARGGGGVYGAKQYARLTPEKFCQGEWATCSGRSAKNFSAVGYYFGKTLQASLDVPIGLICPAIGGTPAEAWVRRGALANDSQLAPMVQGNWLKNPMLDDWCRRRAHSNLSGAFADGIEPPEDDLGLNHSFKPGFMWEAGVAPLAPFPIRGVIWYQGESNAESPRRVAQHKRIFEVLVSDWRQQWGHEKMPFLFVQLPALGRENWPAFRQTQLECLRSLDHTGMAITIDTGHPSNVHPIEKRPVGERLARIAEGMVYKKQIDASWSGPIVRRVRAEGARVAVEFDHGGDQLVANDGQPPKHFEIAGTDKKFVTAEARINGNQVAVWSDHVPEPRHVRYAWIPFPKPPVNLFNQAGLPASPFEAPVGYVREGSGR